MAYFTNPTTAPRGTLHHGSPRSVLSSQPVRVFVKYIRTSQPSEMHIITNDTPEGNPTRSGIGADRPSIARLTSVGPSTLPVGHHTEMRNLPASTNKINVQSTGTSKCSNIA